MAPDFGFAWVRLAELEFGEGRTQAALDALTNAQSFSPENAQMHALQGFIRLASGDTDQADQAFSQAIALDGALGNAWLGRGLVHIKQGRNKEGRLAIQTAAVLEPQPLYFRKVAVAHVL